MNEFDEEMANVYRKTNEEITILLCKSQERQYKSTIIMSILCVILSFSVIIVSVLGYLNNKQWIEVFNSYEYTTEEITYTQDGNGINNFNNREMGDVTNGSNNCN